MELLDRIRRHEAVVTVMGMGYVGLPLAVRFASVGFPVIGVDVDSDRVQQLNSGHSYVQDVADASLHEQVRTGRFRASTEYGVVGDADVLIICVPTPLTKHRQPDTRFIESSVESILPHLHSQQLVILESTTYPGTTEEILQTRIESRGLVVGQDVFLAFSPERVDPGNPTYATANTPKVVGGVTDACTGAASMLYGEIIEAGVHTVSSPRAAEMTKLLENIFRVVNISLVNELAMLSERIGLDIWEVIEAAKTKPFGFMPFYPGPGLGGHCIPLDPFYLSWKAKEYGFTTRFIELAGEINEAMPRHVVDRAAEILNEQSKALRGARVLLLGMAYKQDIGDTRESPALRVAGLLKDRGADVAYHDPHVPTVGMPELSLKSLPLTRELLEAQDLVIVTTGHSGVDYTLLEETGALTLDTRHVVERGGHGRVHHLGQGA